MKEDTTISKKLLSHKGAVEKNHTPAWPHRMSAALASPQFLNIETARTAANATTTLTTPIFAANTMF
jgi:hypothetical protein